MKRLCIITIVLLVSAVQAHALPAVKGSVRIDNLDGKTELLASRCLTQDDEGRIWFGTDKSLFSYDGYTLKSYLRSEGHLQVNAVFVDDHKVFVGCNDGLYVYDLFTEEFQDVVYFNKDRVRSLVGVDGCLYIGTMSGLYRYRYKELENASSISKFSSDVVLSLQKDNGNLLVGTASGAYKFNVKDETITDINLKNAGIVSCIRRTDASSFLIGSPNSLKLLDSSTGEVLWTRRYPVVSSVDQDAEGRILVGTDNGLYLFDDENDTDERLFESPVWSSMKDKDGNIWLATENGLLFCKTAGRIHSVNLMATPSNTLFNYILKDSDNRIWASSNQGLIQLDYSSEGQYNLSRRFSVDDNYNHLPHNRIKKIAQSSGDGSLLLASDVGYLKYNETSGQFIRNSIPQSSNWVYDILTDGDKTWFSTFDGVYCVSDGEVVLHITTNDGLSSNDVAQIVKDRSDLIWMLTRDQTVYVYDPSRQKLEQILADEYSDGEYVDCLFSKRDGTVWAATNRGLLSFDGIPGSRPERHFLFFSNLSIETYSINEIMGRIWVCTSEGVYTYDIVSGQVDRINSNEIFSYAYQDSQNDNILLASLGKLSFFSIFDVDELFRKDNQHIRVTSIIINGNEPVSMKDIEAGHVVLKGGRNNLKISFSDFDYAGDNPSTYYFSITHNKTVWNEAKPGNDIVLSELKPGRYSLAISPVAETSFLDGACLEIKVCRPWYFSIPMLALYLLAISLLVGWIIRYMTLKKYLDLEREQRSILLEQFKQKEEFFSNIAHEFKTPLSLIIAPLSKLIKDTKDGSTQEMLKLVQENANKLSSLVHHTLDYYKENSDSSYDLIKTELEFVEFSRTIFSTYKDNYPKHEFIFDSSSNEILVDADVVKMETVINNLLSNACKYTPEGGSVIMTLERDNTNDALIMKVSDTGIGIPEVELPLIFNRYFESSRTKNENYDSTGIGLSVIKKIVTDHGGSVTAASDDNGTTFTVIIPCLKDRTVSDNIDEPTSLGMESKPLIVIVDDNAQVCSFLESVLKDKYRCISSNNGKSGLKLCVDVMPDLVISDVMMPVMDGLEMCSQIRKFNLLSTIPIILLTAKGDKTTEKRSIELNIDSFVPKPFDLSTLLARIDQLIGSKQRMEQKLRIEMISKPVEKHDLSFHEQFLQKVTALIEEHIDDSDLSVTSLCALGGYSEKQLYRTIKQMTGLSTIEYIRSIRMKKAAILLQNGNFTVSEVMYSVGFSNPSYFTRSFSAEFGKTPSEYMKSYRES